MSSSCRECGHTELVEDWKQGDTICRNCGLVAERLIDPGEEKRHFADSDDNPHRTSVENSYVHSLGTTMSVAPGSRSNLTRIADHTIGTNDRNIISGIEEISRLCTHLKLATRIATASKKLYSEFERNRPKFTRGKDQVTFVAIICIACKHEGFARSYKELASETGVDVKQLRKNCIRIQKVVDQPRTDAVEAKDLIPRICSQLRPQLSYKNMRYVEDVADRVRPHLTGKRPNTVAAVSIKLVCDAVGDTRFEKDIAGAADITAATLRSGFKQLQAVASSELLPADLLAVAPPRAVLLPSPPDPASGLTMPAFPGSPSVVATPPPQA